MDNITISLSASIASVLGEQLDITGVPASTINSISQRAANKAAFDIVSGVNLSIANALNTIPSETDGNLNNLDLQNGNLTSRDITAILENRVVTDVVPNVSASVALTVVNDLKTTLPPGQLSNIETAVLQDTINSVLSGGVVTSSTKNVLSDVTNNLLSNSSTQKPGLDLNALTASVGNATATGDLSNPKKTVVNTSISLLQGSTRPQTTTLTSVFDTFNDRNREVLSGLNVGFKDPNANYPQREPIQYLSEIPSLAQGEVKGSVHQIKNKQRMTGARLPGKDSWDQPPSPYNGKYPYNHVEKTESGHVFESDDTPGSERIHTYHRSGTFQEIDPNGSMVRRIKGSSYEIIDKNGKISISGRADISINGDCRIFVGNDADIQVDGSVNLVAGNDINAFASGKLNLSAVEEVNVTSGGKINFQSVGETNIKSGSNFNIQSEAGDVNIKAGNSTKIQSELGSLNLLSNTGGVNIEAGSALNLLAGGIAAIDGSMVAVASFLATGASGASGAGNSQAPLLNEGRKTISKVNIDDPVFIGTEDGKAVQGENVSLSDQQDNLLFSGVTTREIFNASPIEIESAYVKPIKGIALVSADERLKKTQQLPGNFALSPNFTLQSVTTNAILSQDNVVGYDDINLKYGEIVYNLQLLALNVLEPVYGFYPDVQILSGFRDRDNTSSFSMHSYGKAVDISFKGATKRKTYEIASRLVNQIIFDEFILNFTNYSNIAWIHISLHDGLEAINRNEVQTYWNNRSYSNGLMLLN